MDCWQFKISGVVQGVGFRPFVYQQATRLGLTGWVRNDGAGVEIEAWGAQAQLRQLHEALRLHAPPLALIDQIDIHVKTTTPNPVPPTQFEIHASDRSVPIQTRVPTDSHVCADCLRELYDPADRRYRYPFINCTHCGPRFTLIHALPYDRAYTTMADFPLCAACAAEYAAPLSRRYHAQPIACPDCGPHCQLEDASGVLTTGDDAISQARHALAQGKIVAIKSLGGFHLAANARNPQAVAQLRARKRRDAKPFALMVRDTLTATQWVDVNAHATALLESAARPIVILPKNTPSDLAPNIAPNNPALGIMLPSAPLHYLLLESSSNSNQALDVLVMTSGNLSGLPIEYDNAGARQNLLGLADYILSHNRDIHIRVDDSVVRLMPQNPPTQWHSNEHSDRRIDWLRKARGYAPYPLTIPPQCLPNPNAPPNYPTLVALGAELKTTVALYDGRHTIYVSQHIGDVKQIDTANALVNTAQHLAQLYELQPTVVIADAHPEFKSLEHPAWQNLSPCRVNHHHAHMAACMVEHGLHDSCLGIIMDGAGYGEISASDLSPIWGGEFLIGDFAHAKRVAHLSPIALLGGDAAVYEPRRIAYALVKQLDESIQQTAWQLPAFASLSHQQQTIYSQMLAKNLNCPKASSMGRLFDGVAALINLCTRAEYEAQGPIELEGLLSNDSPLLPLHECYPLDTTSNQLNHRPWIQGILTDLHANHTASDISLRFHSTLVHAITQLANSLCQQHQLKHIVLSGGVFHNAFLTTHLLTQLRLHGYQAYAHQHIPTGDGGLSVGQIMVALHQKHARL